MAEPAEMEAQTTGARWINVLKPFDYYWPDRTAVTYFGETGDHFVKGEVADFAVAKGYAEEGKADPKSRSSKGKRATHATTADSGSAEGVDSEAPADADRPDDRPAVDHDAG